MNKKALMTLIAALMISGTAFAASNEQAPTFEALDTNKDSVISKEEAVAMEELAQDFEKADVNQDNNIDESEYTLVVNAEVEKK